MRNLKFLFGLAIVLLLTFSSSSCAKEDEESLDGYVEALPPIQSAIKKHIADHKKELTRSGELVKLEPVIYDGDTVMYVANYNDGWEVFSNSTTMPMVLMRSDKGHFNDSMLEENPAFAAFFDMSKANLAAEMHDASAEAQPGSEEWADYGVQTVNGGIMRKPAPEPIVLVATGFVDVEKDIVDHLLKTKWHQDSPYNQFIPYMGNGVTHSHAGCASVALAQYLYYWHNQYGLPPYSVTSATYNAVTNTYSFSGSSVTIWDEMPFGDWLFITIEEAEVEARPAALLIGNIASCLGTIFAEEESLGSNTITDIMASYVNEQTHQTLLLKNFASASIYNMLKSKKPVITNLFHTGDSTGHAVVTDYVRQEKSYRDYYYVPQSIAGNIQPWEVETGISFDLVIQRYGSANVTIERKLESISYYFKVNWGKGRFAQDPEINGTLLEVSYGNTIYDSIEALY